MGTKKALEKLKWKTRIGAKAADVPLDIQKIIPNAKAIQIHGVAIDDSVNQNGWAVSEEELDNIAAQLNTGNIQLRIDHGDSVQDVIGKVTAATRVGKTVEFDGLIVSSNENILVPILAGNVDHVSIQADAAKCVCSKCGADWAPFKECECDDVHQIISGTNLIELSTVASPAYKDTAFTPIGFVASINIRLKAMEALKKAQENPEFKEMFEKEQKEHPNLPEETVQQIVEDHLKKEETEMATKESKCTCQCHKAQEGEEICDRCGESFPSDQMVGDVCERCFEVEDKESKKSASRKIEIAKLERRLAVVQMREEMNLIEARLAKIVSADDGEEFTCSECGETFSMSDLAVDDGTNKYCPGCAEKGGFPAEPEKESKTNPWHASKKWSEQALDEVRITVMAKSGYHADRAEAKNEKQNPK